MILSVPVDNVPLYKEQYMSLYYILDTENYKGIESEIPNWFFIKWNRKKILQYPRD